MTEWASGNNAVCQPSCQPVYSMKKRILQFLGILGVNLVVTFLAGSAFLLYIFKGDPILAAVPAVLALPGLLLQPWFILSALVPGGLLTAPFLTTLISFPLYILLDRRGKLDKAWLAIARLRSRRKGMIIGSVLAFLFAIGFARYMDFPALQHGAPPSLHRAVEILEIDPNNSRHYCLGSFLDSEWL